jgi:hypothetical protein
MKTIKNFLVTLAFAFVTLTSFTQISGYSFQSFYFMPIDETEKQVESSEFFSFSMSDGYLCHTVLRDGKITDSQFYRILSHDVRNYIEDGMEFIEISTNVMSGKSLSSYQYIMYITNDFNILTLGEFMYVGTATILKTYKQ